MKKNDKKSKIIKIALLVIIIALVLFGVIYFISTREPKARIFNCTMQVASTDAMNVSMEVEFHYTNRMKKMIGIINYEVFDKKVQDEIKDLETYMADYYKNMAKGDSVKIGVSSENNKLIINFDVDYDLLEKDDITKNSFMSEVTLDKDKTLEEVIENLEKSGGICVEM